MAHFVAQSEFFGARVEKCKSRPRETKSVDHRAGQVRKESLPQIAVDVGLTDRTLRDIMEKYGVKSIKKQYRRSRASREPFSILHQQIGAKLNMYRELTMKEAPKPFAGKMGIASSKLRDMELGYHNFTLSELVKIAEMIGMPLGRLTTKEVLRSVA